jgi:hypothetical protein
VKDKREAGTDRTRARKLRLSPATFSIFILYIRLLQSSLKDYIIYIQWRIHEGGWVGSSPMRQQLTSRREQGRGIKKRRKIEKGRKKKGEEGRRGEREKKEQKGEEKKEQEYEEKKDS